VAVETKIDPSSFLEKCYIYWKTRNYGRRIEAISVLLAVAIYINKNIYEEELRSANQHLLKIMKNHEDVDNVMSYIKMKLGSYQEDNELWLHDRQDTFNRIIKDEELYGCMSDVFNADNNFDESEQLFEEALKRLL